MIEARSTAPVETALVETHRALGARLIEFGGWLMPVQYTGIMDEHRAVRTRVGLFDLSHMGQLWVSGPQAGTALAGNLVTDPCRLVVGRAHYSMICQPDGGIIDDLIVYRTADERFLVVPNAGNRSTVADLLAERFADTGDDVELDDASLRTSLLALQGPLARTVLAPLTDVDLNSLRYYAIAAGTVAGIAAWIARTGYTGEDGFELFVDWHDGPELWRRLMAADAPTAPLPAGLGARDTLRLEAGMPLYGNELDRDTNPYEAGLGRVVKLDKPGQFVGREALQAVADAGPRRRLIGLVLTGRGIARHGYPVYRAEEAEPCGVVTSGAPSPTLGQSIAMAYGPSEAAEPGTMLEIGIRDTRVHAEVVPLPFYKRPT